MRGKVQMTKMMFLRKRNAFEITKEFERERCRDIACRSSRRVNIRLMRLYARLSELSH